MGLKKKLVTGLIREAIKRRGFRGYIKKLIVLAVTLGVVFLIVAFLLLGYTFNQVNKMLSETANINVVAMESLIREKVIVLSQDQKETLIPLLKQLANEEQSLQQSNQTETKILGVLSNQQMNLVLQRAKELGTDSANLYSAGRSSTEELLNRYTEISFENLRNLVNSLLGWWNVNIKDNNAADNLLQQIEGSQ